MAISVSGLTAHTQEGSGTWVDFGGGAGSSSTTSNFYSGASARGRKFSGTKGMGFEVNASGTDLSNTVLVVRFLLAGGFAATRASSGGQIAVQDTSGNISYWDVTGSDVYASGWQVVAISTSLSPTSNNGTDATLTSVQYVGMQVNANGGSGGDPNFLIDEVLSFPDAGLTVSANSTQWITDLVAWDTASLYGVVEQRSGVAFSIASIVLAPDATGLSSTDESLVFEEPLYYDGSNLDAALASISLSCADSDPLTLTRASVVAYSNPSLTGTSADRSLSFASATDVTCNTALFRGFDGATMALGGSGNSYTDCTFQGCSEITDTGAVVRGGFVRNTAATGTSAAYLWNGSTDWQDVSFRNNAAAIRHASEGDFSYIGLTFSGNTIDVRNGNNATSIQSYANTNQDSEVNIGDGTLDAAAQSFQVGTAGQLVRARFYLRKQGTPTGLATVALYAHSGTFGTSSVPTGAALVAATTLDVSTLTGTLADVDFYFEAAAFYDLTGGPTNYCIVIDCSAITGDGSNYVVVGYDGSSPTSAGNAATQASGGGWTAQSYDLIHEVWRDGEVQVNASGGADPALKSRDGSPASAIAIINTVTHTVVNLRTNDRVVWIRVSDEAVLENKLEASGEATYSYNYAGALPVYVQILSGDNTKRNTITQVTLGASDAEFTAVQVDDNVYANP